MAGGSVLPPDGVLGGEERRGSGVGSVFRGRGGGRSVDGDEQVVRRRSALPLVKVEGRGKGGRHQESGVRLAGRVRGDGGRINEGEARHKKREVRRKEMAMPGIVLSRTDGITNLELTDVGISDIEQQT